MRIRGMGVTCCSAAECGVRAFRVGGARCTELGSCCRGCCVCVVLASACTGVLLLLVHTSIVVVVVFFPRLIGTLFSSFQSQLEIRWRIQRWGKAWKASQKVLTSQNWFTNPDRFVMQWFYSPPPPHPHFIVHCAMRTVGWSLLQMIQLSGTGSYCFCCTSQVGPIKYSSGWFLHRLSIHWLAVLCQSQCCSAGGISHCYVIFFCCHFIIQATLVRHMAGLDQICYVHGMFELNSSCFVAVCPFLKHVTDCLSFPS